MFGIKTLGYKLEEYLTTTSTLSLLVQVFSVGASVIGIVLTVLKIPYVSYIILTLLLLLSLFLLIINARLFDEKQKVRDSLTKLVDVQRQQYKYLAIEHSLRVEPSGDGWFSNSYHVAPTGAAVHWIKLRVGITNNTPGVPFAGLRFIAENDKGVGLDYFIINDEPRNKEFIVFFDRPATPTAPYKFKFSYTWPASCRALLLKLQDYGYSAFQSDVENYNYKLEVPSIIQVQNFSVSPPLPDPPSRIVTTYNTIEWTIVGGVPKEEYRYDIKCLKT